MDKIAGVIRHVLTAAAGALVALGTIDQDTANQGLDAWANVVGSITFLVGLGWSIVEKFNRPEA